MNSLDHYSYVQSAHRFCFLVFSLVAALGVLVSSTAQAQPQAGVEYETRLFLPSAADPESSLGVDEAVFRWQLLPGDYSENYSVTEADLEFLQLKVDDTSPAIGGVIIDDIIVDGAVQLTNGRNSEDVVWEFEFFNPADFEEEPGYTPDVFDPATDPFDALLANIGPGELLQFRNIVQPTDQPGTGEAFFQVVDGSNYPLGFYEVVTYASGDDKSWELAKSTAESMFLFGKAGYLATITSADEDARIDELVELANGSEAWAGAVQDLEECPDPSLSTPLRGWKWLNGEGCLSDEGAYTNWLPGEPNDAGNGESSLAVNLDSNGEDVGWNDEGNLANIGSFVVEYPRAAVYIVRFIDGVSDDDGAFEPTLIQRTARIEAGAVRNIPTPLGTGTIFDIDAFEQEGDVAVAGLTNADFCVAPDPREVTRRFWGRVWQYFQPRNLRLHELAGTGTCTGALPGIETTVDPEFETWEELLGVIDLAIPYSYRGFVGEVDLPGDSPDEGPVEDVWLTIGVVRSTAEYDGPVSVVGFPETLIDYSNMPLDKSPVCENGKAYRPLDLGGTVPNFGEWPNVEGSKMIVETVQCNRSWSLTRRTTHVFPVRIDLNRRSRVLEWLNVYGQSEGIQDTISEAGSCANIELLDAVQASLDDARDALWNLDYTGAIGAFEQLARDAYNDDSYDSGEVTGFDDCPIVTNYRGNLVPRALTAAFTVHDRLLHPLNFVEYPLPAEFEELKPDLRLQE